MIIRNSIHAPIRKKRLSIDEIKSRIVGESFELVSTEYVNAHTKVNWKCYKCGNIFQSTWLNISFGWGCSFCKKIRTSVRIKEMRKSRGDGISYQEAKIISLEKGFEFIQDINEYISNLSRKQAARCLVCDRFVKIRLQDIKTKSGYGCWDCSRPKKEKSHFWRGGCVKDYPVEWTNRLRENIRNRDDRKCQYPDCSYSDINQFQRLHVHHINGYKQDCREINLISLCNKHHTKIESSNPRNWEDYFYAITQDYEMR